MSFRRLVLRTDRKVCECMIWAASVYLGSFLKLSWYWTRTPLKMGGFGEGLQADEPRFTGYATINEILYYSEVYQQICTQGDQVHQALLLALATKLAISREACSSNCTRKLLASWHRDAVHCVSQGYARKEGPLKLLQSPSHCLLSFCYTSRLHISRDMANMSAQGASNVMQYWSSDKSVAERSLKEKKYVKVSLIFSRADGYVQGNSRFRRDIAEPPKLIYIANGKSSNLITLYISTRKLELQSLNPLWNLFTLSKRQSLVMSRRYAVLVLDKPKLWALCIEALDLNSL